MKQNTLIWSNCDKTYLAVMSDAVFKIDLVISLTKSDA